MASKLVLVNSGLKAFHFSRSKPVAILTSPQGKMPEYLEGNKPRVRMPQLPSISALRFSSKFSPIAVRIPMPVTKILLTKEILLCSVLFYIINHRVNIHEDLSALFGILNINAIFP